MKTTSKKEGDLKKMKMTSKNEENLKNEDDLENKEDLKTKDNLKNYETYYRSARVQLANKF